MKHRNSGSEMACFREQCFGCSTRVRDGGVERKDFSFYDGGRGVKNWPSPNLALYLFRYFDLCSSRGHKIHVKSRQNGYCIVIIRFS